MTRAEYLEFVQESLSFIGMPLPEAHTINELGFGPELTLRDTPEVCAALSMAHAEYCAVIEKILFPERAAEVDEELAGYKMLVSLQARV